MATFLLLLAAIVTAQLVSWFLFRAARAARDFPDAGPRRVVMHYCSSIRLAAVVLPAIVLVLLVMLLDSPAIGSAASRQWLIASFPLVALLAAAIAAEAWSRRIVLDDVGMHSASVWGRSEIGWDSIARVSWNRWLKMLVVTANDGRRLWVNPSLSGLSMFQLLLFERVDRRRLDGAIPGFIALGRGAY